MLIKGKIFDSIFINIKNMDLICKCGNECFISIKTILKNFKEFYAPCDKCEDYELKKFSPLSNQIDLNSLDEYFGKCICGKRHLDVVMGHILKIMIEEGIKDQKSTLRTVCVPLITPAFPLESAPYLKEDTLVILSPDIDKNCAVRILKEIPEVKGVLKGNLQETVGIKESRTSPFTYDLLAGCDLRCDIINTPWQVINICKYQSQIHIEVPKPLSPKIKKLKDALNKYNNPKILDCTCGPGTLGIAALCAGARRVVFNDLWPPACQTTAMNLELNGFPVEYLDNNNGLIGTGENFEIYCLDIKDLKRVMAEKFDLCLVDVFPGVDPQNFVDAVEDICHEVVVI
jgi:hypothetical protein